MRHPLPWSERINIRMIALLAALLALVLVASIYRGTARVSAWGPEWSCEPNAAASSTVCIKDVTKHPASGG